MTANAFKEVQNLLKLESEAIAETGRRLNQSQVERAIELLLNCKGKVVVLGIGKIRHHRQKIAATMTSAGTAAIYLHPSDALHGGLGILQSDDVAMLLSNSGETEELVAMLPYLKNRNTR